MEKVLPVVILYIKLKYKTQSQYVFHRLSVVSSP